jgi:hypothetical protein
MRINPGSVPFLNASVISRKHPRGGAGFKSLAELVPPSGFVQSRRNQALTLVGILILGVEIGDQVVHCGAAWCHRRTSTS